MDISKISECKKQICRVSSWLWEKSMVAAYDGNISARLEEDRFLCTASKICKGVVAEHNLVIVNSAGKLISGIATPTSEIKLHLEIYKNRPDINAVVHAHPPYATAFAVAGFAPDSKTLPELESVTGAVGFAKFAAPGSGALAKSVTPLLEQNITTILLERHGAVTASTSNVLDAYYQIEKLEAFCKIMHLAKSLG